MKNTSVKFGKVDAELSPSIAKSLGADEIPFVAFLGPSGEKLDALVGWDPQALVKKVKQLAPGPFSSVTLMCKINLSNFTLF